METDRLQISKVLIYTPDVTPRMEYIVDFLFGTILGVEVEFTASTSHFMDSDLPKINYSDEQFAGGLFLNPHPLLFSKSIEAQPIEATIYRNLTFFFPTSGDSFLPFDPFACSFYLISRYEEYLGEKSEDRELFADPDNLLVSLGMHGIPVVDKIAGFVAEKISEAYPGFTIKMRNFSFCTTIDIDNAWAFKNKNMLISAGAFLKALAYRQWSELKQRMVVALGLKSDPYDTYSFILSTYQGRTDLLRFFFLIGDRNRFDKNISHKNKAFRQLIANLASVCDVGIHSSYASEQKIWLLRKEKERLESIIGRPVTQSRQHKVNLRFPQTYHNLLKSGITDDYSMGFATRAGFRAGTCTPFQFFDLKKNKRTELLIHPFVVMDISLKNHLHQDAGEAWQTIENLMKEVKDVNGTFVSLWHNDALRESGQWEGWREIFKQTLATGISYMHE